MKRSLLTTLLLVLFAASLYGQGAIINTLGFGGAFSIRYDSLTFLSLPQSTGYLTLHRSLTLPLTTDSTHGVIFKGAHRFIHDYWPPKTGGYNTFVGLFSGNFTMSGAPQTHEASYNTAVGASSLTSLTTGAVNSAFGASSLTSNTKGEANSAFGSWSLYSNTTGSRNSAFGELSLQSNTTGNDNSAFGSGSLYFSTTGEINCAFGVGSLHFNTTGSENSAFGNNSLLRNTTGRANSAFGIASLQLNTTGFENSALGYYAGSNLTTGSNNTIIGNSALASSAEVSNEITLGNSSITTLRCQVATITALSDARDKKNIRDLPLGLDFLMSVRPRLFNWDRREWYDGKADGSKMQENPTAGFIAQELDEAQTKEHAEWLNLVLKSNPDRLEATPGNLLPIMVKAIQELKIRNEALRNELVTLRGSIAEQVKKEVQAVLLKAVQPEDKPARVSLNETKN